jgi:drug/metabolite transporter (DMT)-like permease
VTSQPVVAVYRVAPGKAVLYMIAAAALLTALDVGVKWLAADYPIPQIAFLRYLVGLGIAAAIASRLGGLRTLRTHRAGGHLLRSALNLATMLSLYYAFRAMPLADALAISYASPLIVTALSVPLLGERVGPRRWTAVVVGFAGVLIIVRPGGEGIALPALLALASAFCYALTLITSRQLSTTESSHTILFYYSVWVLVAMGAVLPWQWSTPAWADLPVFLFVGVSGSLGQFCLAQALRYGEASMLAPIDFTAILWAILFGFLFWRDVPSWTMIGGAALVIATSIYIAHREARSGWPNRRSAVGGKATQP